jgi:DNA polymerase III epsilon subunit-like protein
MSNPEKKPLAVAWIDTETTGIDPRCSGAFEIALLIYKGPQCVLEKLYRLNPLDDEVKWSEEAFKINGVTEETMRFFPLPSQVVPEIIADLKAHIPPERYAFAGYNCGFDFSHIGAAFFRAGFTASDYFNGRFIDVYELVKKADAMRLLPETSDKKLETMAKALGINPGNSHSAMDDIKATRRLYEALYHIQKKRR